MINFPDQARGLDNFGDHRFLFYTARRFFGKLPQKWQETVNNEKIRDKYAPFIDFKKRLSERFRGRYLPKSFVDFVMEAKLSVIEFDGNVESNKKTKTFCEYLIRMRVMAEDWQPPHDALLEMTFGVPKEQRLYEGDWSNKCSKAYLTPTGIGFSTPQDEGRTYAIKDTQIVSGTNGLCSVISLLSLFELPPMPEEPNPEEMENRFVEIANLITTLAEMKVPKDCGSLFVMMKDEPFQFDEDKCCNDPRLSNCGLMDQTAFIKGCTTCGRIHTASNVGTDHSVFRWFLENLLDANVVSHDSVSTLVTRTKSSLNALVFSPPAYVKKDKKTICSKVGHMGVIARFLPQTIHNRFGKRTVVEPTRRIVAPTHVDGWPILPMKDTQ